MSDAPVAIVTGASSGIGRAAAAGLVEVGYHVVLAARNGGKLEALAGELGRDRTTARPADVADADQVAALVQATVADRGRLDALVNVAGMAVLKPLAETTV